ncbi:MAG TPA: hypothetical protein VK152_05960 [Paludibacter sp.]|nr:hypothetical protein [Paludibacter sp.]
MKPTYFYQLLFALFITTTASGAENVGNSEPIVISGTKFTYPLVERWIAEYQKANPNTNIRLVAKANAGQVSDLSIIAHQPAQNELQPTQEIIYTGRYALLPVTNNNNPILVDAARKGLDKKELDKLFFEVLDYDSDEPVQKSKFTANIYSRDNKSCTSITLAGHFGHQSSEIRGKKVFGDDIYLLSALKKDSVGLTYNVLNYVFDTNSRTLKSGLAILPVNLRKEAKVIQGGSLDDVLGTLEKNQVETIPVEKIGFVYDRQSARKEVSAFLKWVLLEGQQFNHGQGFLTIDKNVAAEQSANLEEKLLTLK